MRTYWFGSALFAALVACAPLNANAAGSIVVAYKDDIATLDPAIGYDVPNWSLIKSLFSRLMDYKPGTAELVPSLAESYTLAPDGLTYTFRIRKGVKFSNGRELVASDVKFSVERAVDPQTKGPGAAFYASIDGYEGLSGGTAKGLKGIETPDAYTVVFRLSRPDATFLHDLASNFASVVPKEVVETEGADFGKKPVGSGAYTLKEWVIGQHLTFVRNADYYLKGTPRLDGFSVEVGQEPLVALLRLQKGEVDIAGDGIPPSKYLEMKKSVDAADTIVDGPQLQTAYVTLNTHIKPFDNVMVRQALNQAINKERLVRIVNGRATPANQPLPPLMPGYDGAYAGYAYDAAKAKALLAKAGYPNGFDTTLYASSTDPNPRIAQAIQQDLAAVGVKAEIKALADANVTAAGGTEGGAPMIWSGGMAWVADFPDPFTFYGPILSCSAASNGGWNWSWYCNRDIDARAAKANLISDPAKSADRARIWSAIYKDIMVDAPWIPVFNERRVVAKSKRMGGPADYYVDPIRFLNYDAMSVKD